MKAVIYARYSSNNQREESIEGQLRECTAFAEKNSVTIPRHYIDRAFSAKTDNRPEFQIMIKDSGKRLFDMIIVWRLDRFARNRYDSARYKAALKKNGVKVVSATEVISDGAEGIILADIQEYFDAFSEETVKSRTPGKGHGRIETREYFLETGVEWLASRIGWADLTVIGAVRSKVEENGKIRSETRCFITSLLDISSFSKAVRRH